MPYCPRCRCEYNIGVERCVDCRVPLVLHRPRRRPIVDIDFEDLLVPIGAVFCMLAGLGLLILNYLATSGQLAAPLGPMIAAQPVCMVVFYAIATAMSGVVLVVSIVRWLVGTR